MIDNLLYQDDFNLKLFFFLMNILRAKTNSGALAWKFRRGLGYEEFYFK